MSGLFRSGGDRTPIRVGEVVRAEVMTDARFDVEARNAMAIGVLQRALETERSRGRAMWDQDLVDLCIDALAALQPPVSAPVIPGRS